MKMFFISWRQFYRITGSTRITIMMLNYQSTLQSRRLSVSLPTKFSLGGETGSPTGKLKMSFQLLGLVQDECSEGDVRRAYIKLAKIFHPDSSSSQANSDKFSELRDAYRKCMSYTKNVAMTREIHAALEQEMSDIDKHLGYSASRQRRLPHRQYLSFDVGTGTVSERQKAHSQQRVSQAMDNVFDKQFEKALENPDAKNVAPYTGLPKSQIPGGKSTKTLQRIANELIYESMRRGEFDNLKGLGKPLECEAVNPVLDTVEQKINNMLKNSGFTPDWVSLDKDIRAATSRLREDMALAWAVCGPYPMKQEQTALWKKHLQQFHTTTDSINKMIFNLNLIVPSLTIQRSNLRLDKLLIKVTENNPHPHSKDVECKSEQEEEHDLYKVTGSDSFTTLAARTMAEVKSWYYFLLSKWHI